MNKSSYARTRTLLTIAMLCWSAATSVASAEQARDWMVGPQPPGSVLNVDFFFPGFQAQLEHRVAIYGKANELLLKANSLVALPFYESQLDVDLRLLVFSIGGSVGYRNTMRALTFAPGESIDREHRRFLELTGKTQSFDNTFGEARAQLALPFNDHVLFLSVDSLRFEGGPDRVFDWRTGVARDSGIYFSSTNTLFLKSHELGSIGPQLQLLDFTYDDRSHTQLNYGFTAVTRPGLMRDNDILFLSMLFNFDSQTYGQHLLYAPFTFQLAYRMVFKLQEM